MDKSRSKCVNIWRTYFERLKIDAKKVQTYNHVARGRDNISPLQVYKPSLC